MRREPFLKAIPEIRQVLEKAAVLEDKVANSFPKKQYIGPALRLIKALAIQRLTTGGIDVSMGVTAKELRDGLCIFNSDLPE